MSDAPEFSFQAVAHPPEATLAALRSYFERTPGVRRVYLVWFWPAGRPTERRQLLCVDATADAAAIAAGIGAVLRATPPTAEVDLLVFDPTDDATIDLMRTIAEPFFVRAR